MLAVTDWCELENSLLRGFSNQSFSLCIEWRMFRDSSVMLVGSEQFTPNHSSLLDSGKKQNKSASNWFGCFLVIKRLFRSHILAVFYRSEECSSNMMGFNLKNHQINEIISNRLGVPLGAPVMTPASKSTCRVHMHDFTCPLRSSYAVMPSDHQSTEKEYPGWEPSKVWKSSGAERQKTCGIVFIAVCGTLYAQNVTKSPDKWSESSSGLWSCQ